MRKLRIVTLLLACSPAFAGGPPIEYRLDDVMFEYVTDEEMLQTWGYAFRIEGTGKGVYHEGTADVPRRVREFEVEPGQVFALLKQCYRAQFFTLEEHYGPPPGPSLQPNGAIQVIELAIADVALPAITVRLGAYSKTIRYVEPYGNPPQALLELVKRLKELAQTEEP